MTRTLLVVALLAAVSPIQAARQDSVSAARELYTTAAYDESLAMLDRLRASKPPAAEARMLEQFRAYCLFALGRTADAEQAIESAVTLDPTWEIADTEAPPRIVTLFRTVRARALPGIIRERFTAAKVLYSDKKHDQAVEAFDSVLALLDNPTVTKIASADLDRPQDHRDRLPRPRQGRERTGRQGRGTRTCAATGHAPGAGTDADRGKWHDGRDDVAGHAAAGYTEHDPAGADAAGTGGAPEHHHAADSPAHEHGRASERRGRGRHGRADRRAWQGRACRDTPVCEPRLRGTAPGGIAGLALYARHAGRERPSST